MPASTAQTWRKFPPFTRHEQICTERSGGRRPFDDMASGMAGAANWQGRVTFDDRYVLFEGSTGDNRLHGHIAAQVVIGAASCIELADGSRISGTAIAVRPHVRHRLLPITNGRVYLIEPTSDVGAALLASLPAKPAQVIEDAQARLDGLLAARRIESIDSRLQAAITALREPASLQASLRVLAREIGLSPERLRTIATRQLGMPLARWRRWAAIRRACMAMAGGCSLVEAAVVGGFSDQPHFTRTTRSMLGITPAVLSKLMH